MECVYQNICGGCPLRGNSEQNYRQIKEQKVKGILNAALKQQNYVWENPIFLPDGTRRRAAMAFELKKGKLNLGFNENHNAQIVDCEKCLSLTPKVNAVLPSLRSFLEKLCAVKVLAKNKKKKLLPHNITKGDILILEADNGLDIVLETDADLDVNHRMEIFEFVNAVDEVIRFSFRRNALLQAEPIVEKIKPVINIGQYEIFVAPGTFLQASKEGQEALISKVTEYLGDVSGNIADLFCGIGTFSYPLALNSKNKIVAADVSKPLLKGFETSINKNMIHNIEIIEKNLFKYPFTAAELSKFEAVVLDPPRAGATAQVKELALLSNDAKLEKIVMVSCNPHSFVNDANVLINGGFVLQKAVMVDQFVYSNHTEMVALFTKK